jgi:plasmid stabilization system protein ParE
MPTLVFRPEAEDEISGTVIWYEERGKGLGAEFLRTFEATLSAIEKNPLQYAIVDGEIRRAVLRRFPYSIMYVVSESELLIIACFHARRDPQVWRERPR